MLGAVFGLGLAPLLVAWVAAALNASARLGPAMTVVAIPVGIISVFAFAFAARRAQTAPSSSSTVRIGVHV